MQSQFPLAIEVIADQMTNQMKLRCDFTSMFGPSKRASDLLERMGDLIEALVQGTDVTLEHRQPENISSVPHVPPRNTALKWSNSSETSLPMYLNSPERDHIGWILLR